MSNGVIRNSETEKNLLKAFEINAKRRMEYDIYALIAEKYGYSDVAKLFRRFAIHEKEHAKLWFGWLHNNNYPTLVECTKNALEQEKDEIEGIYETFAKKAKEEGLLHISGLFENIEEVEKIHYDRMRKLIIKLEDEAPANDDGTYNWVCSTCGAVFVQKEEPEYCPLCLKEEVFFYKK